MSVQTKIDFTRAEQLATLRDAQLSPATIVEGATTRRVTAIVLKSVLRAIDDHGRGGEAWVSYETIAREAGCSLRQAKRAVVALVELSLLCVETRRTPYGAVVNHYRVVWNELALRRPRHQQVECVGAASAPTGNQAGEEQGASSLPNLAARRAIAECPGDRPECPGDEAECPGDRPECPGGHSNRPEPTKKRTEPTGRGAAPRTAAGGGWVDLIREWRSRIAQVVDLAQQAQDAGEQLEAFRSRLQQAWATATSPANADRFHKPAGAVVHFLRRGSWPVDRVVEFGDEPAERAAVEQAIAVDERRQRREFDEACRAAHQVVFLGRRQRATDDAISAALRQRFPPAVVEAIGWGGGVVEIGGEQTGEA